MKRMKHKLHGFTHVYYDSEEKSHREHGWVEESEPYPGDTEAPGPVVKWEPEHPAVDADGDDKTRKPRSRSPRHVNTLA